MLSYYLNNMSCDCFTTYTHVLQIYIHQILSELKEKYNSQVWNLCSSLFLFYFYFIAPEKQWIGDKGKVRDSWYRSLLKNLGEGLSPVGLNPLSKFLDLRAPGSYLNLSHFPNMVRMFLKRVSILWTTLSSSV